MVGFDRDNHVDIPGTGDRIFLYKMSNEDILIGFIDNMALICEKTDELKFNIDAFMKSSGIQYQTITSRVKTSAGLREKLTRKSYESLNDFPDCGGIRVVCQDPIDVENAKEYLIAYLTKCKTFKDSALGFEFKEFVDGSSRALGCYDSHHIVMSYLGIFCVEIQLRTSLDEIVYNAMHPLYKSRAPSADQLIKLTEFITTVMYFQFD